MNLLRLFVGATMAAAAAGFGTVASADAGHCAELNNLKLPDVKVTKAAAVPAPTNDPITVAYCRVEGIIGSEITFALLLPEAWNHKFMMGGAGGFAGSVANQALEPDFLPTPVLNLGYATVGTDTGHQGSGIDGSWALNNLERQVNYGYLGVHRTAEVAKAILRTYYGSDATRSYFFGCSNGGREALMEAQRFPDDFDGVVAGAPAADFTAIAAQFIKDTRAQFPDSANLTPLIPSSALQSVATQILDKCDALDGVKDGVMEDPRRCTFDPSTLVGLTPAQRTAIEKIYAPTRAGNDTIFPAQPFGGEEMLQGWPLWISGAPPRAGEPQAPSLRFAFGTQFFKFFVFGDPAWDYRTYDLSTWKSDTRSLSPILNATNPNLDAFKAKGHKLVIWHGWSDAALSALATIKYYDQVKARDPQADDYVRLFMLPGVLHCAGGPGPDHADWVSVIDDWLNGTPPDRIIARKISNGMARTRPLCPYPQEAVYKGRGSTDDADNFACGRR
jgi:hypothetical protein